MLVGAVVGAVWVPFRYSQYPGTWVAVEPTIAKATKSPGIDGLSVTLTLIIPPPVTLAAEGVKDTVELRSGAGGGVMAHLELPEVTVTGMLVATRLKVSFAKSRNSYWPGVEGIAKVRVPLVTGLEGRVGRPPRYIQ